MNRIGLILLAASLHIGCASHDAPDDKGSEDSPLIDGKTDSFFRPTEHGEASFTRGNQASITEDQSFHAWTFELTGEANLELKTEIATRNLDTVMYLYFRESVDDSWGRYIEKNDDHDGNLWSQIDGGFDVGHYRVIVKPFKTTMTGEITLRASCEGDGCPVVGDGECSAEVNEGLPTQTGYGEGCDQAILEVVTSEMQYSNSLDVPVDEKCDLNPIAAKAVDYYISYWDDVYGFEDLFGTGDPDEPIHLHVEEFSHDKGTVVWIDAYADEDGMRFVFDFDGKLLALYQSNQSPDHRFYCADQVGDAYADFPGCWNDSIGDLRWDIDSRLADDGFVTVEEAAMSDELNRELVAAIGHFSETLSLQAADEISYELIYWDSPWTAGAEVTLTHETNIATYWAASGEVVAVSDGDGLSYACEMTNL